MRLTVVRLKEEITSNFETFLYRKNGVSPWYKGNYNLVHDGQVERTDSLAATIFIRKDTIILYHWHISKSQLELEDITCHPLNAELDKMEATLLFNTLLDSVSSRTRRAYPIQR